MSAATMQRLRVAATDMGERRCLWRAVNEHDMFARLQAEAHLHTPARRFGGSATDEARLGFQNLPTSKAPGGVTVRGLGDEARLVHVNRLPGEHHEVRLAVRVRNIVVDLFAEQKADIGEYGPAVSSFAVLEAGLVSAAGEIGARLGARPQPAAPPAYQRGEHRSVGNVCAQADAAARRLVAGARRRDLAPGDAGVSGGCKWADGDAPPGLSHLTVYVEAPPPSAATGQSGTAVAKALFAAWRGDGSRAPKLGDQAKRDHVDSTASRLLVRRANLLLYIDYGRRDRPSKAAMDREVAALAQAVLAAQR
ncbi:hypothetical protein [Actinomadura sp. NBRC 104412]|uniref:hypothetical protein n=1 Tax=Actinomadura sp. NBRC 104412 TaxID=3032203 RepID=UPI0025523EB3|nr:hypothetical protein [Actinomadura sp. NBRC 104412]